MRLFRPLLVLAALAPTSATLAACSGSDASPAQVQPVADSGSDTAVEGATDAPPPPEDASDATSPGRGSCASSSDCAGNACLAVPSGNTGWHTCAAASAGEATTCSGGSFDVCCSSSDCADGGSSGGCYLGPLWYCGGAMPQPYNLCVRDACSSDGDCSASAMGVCVPAGAFGEMRSVCAYGGCRLDADCASRAGGACMPFFDPCNRRFTGLQCTYADSLCRSDADCPTNGDHCTAGQDGHTTCEPFHAPP